MSIGPGARKRMLNGKITNKSSKVWYTISRKGKGEKMKIELSETEMKMIENLLMDAALSSTNYTMQGKFRELKEYFLCTIINHQLLSQLKGN